MREPSAPARHLFTALQAAIIVSVRHQDPSEAVAVAVRFMQPALPVHAPGLRRLRYTLEDGDSRVIFTYATTDEDTGRRLHTFEAVLAVEDVEIHWHHMQFLGEGEQDDHENTGAGRPDGR